MTEEINNCPFDEDIARGIFENQCKQIKELKEKLNYRIDKHNEYLDKYLKSIQKLKEIQEITKDYYHSLDYNLVDSLTDLVDDLFEVLGIGQIIESEE